MPRVVFSDDLEKKLIELWRETSSSVDVDDVLQSTSLITTLGGATEKCRYSRSAVIPEVSLYVLQCHETLLWA